MTFKKGNIPWNKGTRGLYSEEHLRKLSEAWRGEKNPNYGKPLSLETRSKISEAKKGQIPWNKGKNIWTNSNHPKGMLGKYHSEKTKRKISETLKGHIGWMKGLTKETDDRIRKRAEALKGKYTGEMNSFYGKRHSTETRMKISEAMKGRVNWSKGLTKETDERIKKRSERVRGEKNPSWKGGISHSINYGENWSVQRLRALQRDHYTCQICNKTIDETQIDVHHIIPFKFFKNYKEANRLENLKCLCKTHHTKADAEFHREELKREILI